jgi:hypothetical protein
MVYLIRTPPRLLPTTTSGVGRRGESAGASHILIDYSYHMYTTQFYYIIYFISMLMYVITYILPPYLSSGSIISGTFSLTWIWR